MSIAKLATHHFLPFMACVDGLLMDDYPTYLQPSSLHKFWGALTACLEITRHSQKKDMKRRCIRCSSLQSNWKSVIFRQ